MPKTDTTELSVEAVALLNAMGRAFFAGCDGGSGDATTTTDADGSLDSETEEPAKKETAAAKKKRLAAEKKKKEAAAKKPISEEEAEAVKEAAGKAKMGKKAAVELMRSKYGVNKVTEFTSEQAAAFIVELGEGVDESSDDDDDSGL